MSTRSFIAKKTKTGYKAIYCHSDGYLGHVGILLSSHYLTDEKIDALLNLGDLSCLDKDIGEKHDFDDYTLAKTKGWCQAYGRDRGETGIEAKEYKTLEELMVGAENHGTEFLYIWENNRWGFSENSGGNFRNIDCVLYRLDISQ